MFTPIHKAGLSPKHVAPMLRVGRVTVSRWLNGHGYPHVQLLPRVRVFLDWVNQALAERKLPFPPTLHRSDENNYVQKLYMEYLRGRK